MGDLAMRFALVLLASLVATPAFADARTYIGKLGDRDIQVELTEPEDGAVVGRFTYSDDGADVPLLPVSVKGDIWTLHEEAPCAEGTCVADDNGVVADPPIAATWTLTAGGDRQVLTGSRVAEGGKSKTLAIELDFVAAHAIEGEVSAFALHDRSAALSYDTTIKLDWDTAAYEMELVAVAHPHGEFIESNGVHYSYATDPRTGLSFPRLVLMTPEVHSLWEALETHFYRASLAALGCKAFRYGSYGVSEYFLGMGGHTAGYEDEQITLDYISPILASWRQEGSLYCQGAHPYNHLDNYTLDGRTGEPLDWRKVFSALVPRPWFSPPEDIVDIETALADPDSYTWGPNLDFIAFIQQRRDTTLFAGEPELDEICASDQAIAEQLRFRVVGENEIMFTLSGFPHVSSVCNTDIFSATLDELAPFLAVTAKDYFPALAK
jgi:hypothetical protein